MAPDPAEVMRAALCEGGYPDLAEHVVLRAGRTMIPFEFPVMRSITEEEARAVWMARMLAHQACGLPTDELLSQDGYVSVCLSRNP
jgi:hypothetical protein